MSAPNVSASPFAQMISQLTGEAVQSLPNVPDAIAEEFFQCLGRCHKLIGNDGAIREALSTMRRNERAAAVEAVIKHGIGRKMSLDTQLNPLTITRGTEHLGVSEWMALHQLRKAIARVNDSVQNPERYVSEPIAEANRSAQIKAAEKGKPGRPKKEPLDQATIDAVRKAQRGYEQSADKTGFRKRVAKEHGISRQDFFDILNGRNCGSVPKT